MRKKNIRTALVAVFCLAVGYTVYTTQNKNDHLSDVNLANIEALAQAEDPGFNCKWSADWTVCNSRGNGLGCPCGSGQW